MAPSAHPGHNGIYVDLFGGGADPARARLMDSVTDLRATAMKNQFGLCVLIRATVALWMMSACVQIRAQNLGDEILSIVVDQWLPLTPVGSFADVATNVPASEIERKSNDDLCVTAENMIGAKSSPAGQSWATHFGPDGATAPPFVTEGNFDGDHDLDITDFNFLASNFALEGCGASARAVCTSFGAAGPNAVGCDTSTVGNHTFH